MTTASMPWIKLYIETLDDAKLGQLSDLLKWRFMQMLLLAGECDQDGWLVQSTAPMTVQQIGWRLRIEVKELERDLNALSRAALMLFDRKLGAWCVVNFEKRQGRPQSKKRELWREQKTRQRRVRADTGRTPPQAGKPVRRREEDLEGEEDLDQEGEGAGAPPPETVGEFAERSSSGKQPDVLPAPVRVYVENGGQFQKGELIDGTTKKNRAIAFICEHVADTPESLKFWGQVVYAYQVQWSAKSYTIMVNDYYLRRRLPGEASRASNGHAPVGMSNLQKFAEAERAKSG